MIPISVILVSNRYIRMADFVSKSIDNLSHGVTVRGAMEKLKLSE